MIPVTKSFLPPIEEYTFHVKRAFKNEWLTNRGELTIELESKLKTYLNLNFSQILLTNNGTLPIQIALKLLGRGGDIITTPFSYIATSSSIIWENCKPIFVDIHPEYLTIDETKIESAISENTTCILATHVFGNPCNVDKIEQIAKKYNLKVIYDAAHCFGVDYKGKSIFEYGNISTCSFHATKLFHTGEGGGLFCSDEELFHKCYYSHNFGHKNPIEFHGLGINAKISELQSSMGLAVLPYMPIIIEQRTKIVKNYNDQLNFKNYRNLSIRADTNWNHSYYPIIFESESHLMKVVEKLNSNNIFPRRYFNPSLNTLSFLSPYYKMAVSEDVASKILCLPLYHSLKELDLNFIVSLINSVE